MPFVEINGGAIHYRIDGPSGAPWLILSNSLGTDLSVWDSQLPSLTAHFRVLRYDTRGHGLSTATAGPYSIELLGRDVVALLDHLNIRQAHFIGLSLGGMVGMWLASHEPARVGKLILVTTSTQLGPPDNWSKRIEAVRAGGLPAVAEIVMARYLTNAFREKHPVPTQAIRNALLDTPPAGYVACCAAIRDMDQRQSLSAIHSPTLVITGLSDPAAPPEHGRAIAQSVRGAKLVELPAAHLANVEASDAFNTAVLEFLGPASSGDRMTEQDRYDGGMTVRRAVLGNAHVDAATAKRTPLNHDFQDFITRYAWGEIWSRPGLDRHTRSMITVAMLIALNRPDELRMHFRASKNNGVTLEEIREIIMHSAIYCGLPAANEAFHLAAEYFSEGSKG